MDMNTLQYVVGEAKAGQPAVIRFFGRVTEETTSRFNDCLLYISEAADDKAV